MTRSVFGSIIFTFISKLSPSTILFKHNVRQNKISARKISRYLIMTSSKQTAEDKPLAIWGNRGELSLVSTRMIEMTPPDITHDLILRQGMHPSHCPLSILMILVLRAN